LRVAWHAGAKCSNIVVRLHWGRGDSAPTLTFIKTDAELRDLSGDDPAKRPQLVVGLARCPSAALGGGLFQADANGKPVALGPTAQIVLLWEARRACLAVTTACAVQSW
jgi:hypothetical protein